MGVLSDGGEGVITGAAEVTSGVGVDGSWTSGDEIAGEETIVGMVAGTFGEDSIGGEAPPWAEPSTFSTRLAEPDGEGEPWPRGQSLTPLAINNTPARPTTPNIRLRREIEGALVALGAESLGRPHSTQKTASG